MTSTSTAAARTAYRGLGWRVPEVLLQVRIADDLYFDAISRGRAEYSSRGHATLVGNATSCVSLCGDGSSLTMVGGDALAQWLAGDLVTGLRTYQSRHRRCTHSKEPAPTTGARLLVAATASDPHLRNLIAHLWPAIALAQPVRRDLPPVTTSDTTKPVNSMAGGRHPLKYLRP